MSYKFFALNRKENYSNKRSQKLNAPRESVLIHCQSTVCWDSGHFEETNKQQCVNLRTNGFKCSSTATYEYVPYMSCFFSLRLCFTRFLIWFLEGFKLVLIVVGSVRTFIFHNIHHRASWIMQKLQCVSNIYNSSPSHWWKLYLWVTQTENYPWHEAIYMNIPSHYKSIVCQWELSHIRIIIISIISSKRIYSLSR